MNGFADPERSAPKIHEQKSGRSMKLYLRHETYAILYKFRTHSWFVKTGVRLAYTGLSQYLCPAGIMCRIEPESKYDEKHDSRLQLFEDSVELNYLIAQRNSPAFFDNPNPKLVNTKIDILEEKLYNNATFQRKPRGRRAPATVSTHGTLFSLAAMVPVCALSYLYISNPTLPDLEEYYVLMPVLFSPFLLISSSLRATCCKALGTLSNKLGKKLI